MKKFLVSTADCRGYDENDNLLFTGTTMLDTSIEGTLQNTDVRAGKGNQLQYIYYHTAELNITVNDAQFSLPFLALNVGSQVSTGANVWTQETVTLTKGQGIVTATPLAPTNTTIYGWVTFPDDTVERVTFTGSNFTVTDVNYNGDVCVRFYAYNAAGKQITIYADMLPSVIKLVMDATLASSDSTTNEIGEVQIEVPKASMTGNFTLSMTPDSVSQTPLQVRALATKGVKGGCDGDRPIYATITEIIYNANWYDNVVALAIEGGDFSLAAEGTKQLRVFAIPTEGAAFLVDNANLTFATSEESKATVSPTGLVTGVAAGSSTIKATVTDKEEIDANVVVTVTG